MNTDMLNQVVTVKEISETYGISPQAVIDAIKSGAINARQSGKTWLILRSEARARWSKFTTEVVKNMAGEVVHTLVTETYNDGSATLATIKPDGTGYAQEWTDGVMGDIYDLSSDEINEYMKGK